MLEWSQIAEMPTVPLSVNYQVVMQLLSRPRLPGLSSEMRSEVQKPSWLNNLQSGSKTGQYGSLVRRSRLECHAWRKSIRFGSCRLRLSDTSAAQFIWKHHRPVTGGMSAISRRHRDTERESHHKEMQTFPHTARSPSPHEQAWCSRLVLLKGHRSGSGTKHTDVLTHHEDAWRHMSEAHLPCKMALLWFLDLDFPLFKEF